MPIPVVQLGTGNVGIHALRALITNPEFELTGVWVSSDAKAGKDAAEIAGNAAARDVREGVEVEGVSQRQAVLGVDGGGREQLVEELSLEP